MRDQEIIGLWEAYSQVHQIDEIKDATSSQDAKIPDFEKEKKAKPVPGLKVNKPPVEEEVDVYDLIREYLLEGGYVETPEAAFAIMANMSENWRKEILDEAKYGTSAGRKKLAKKIRKGEDIGKKNVPGKTGFKAVEAKAKKSGASDPAAVAAAAMWKKYGK